MTRNHKLVLTILLFMPLVTGEVFAKGSIYSLRGYGVYFYFPGGRASGMGGATIAVANSAYLNWLNPASFSFQDHVRISAQFLYQNLNINDSFNRYNTNYANFNGFMAAFPVYSGIGIGFGIHPYTKVNFEFETTKSINHLEYTSRVSGLGGLNRLFLATGIRIFSRLRVGTGIGFIFGKSDESWRVNFLDSDLKDTYDRYRSKYWGLNADFSLLFMVMPGWNLGAVYQSEHSLNKTLDIRYFQSKLSDSFNSRLTIPSRWGVGTSISLKQRLLFALDYLYQDWESSSTSNAPQSDGFTKLKRFSAGLEYGLPIKMGMSFLKMVRYRFGFTLEQPYILDYSNRRLQSYSITIGFGIPFASGAGDLDFAFEYGKRGKLPDNSFEESIFRFTLYISGGELWFQR